MAEIDNFSEIKENFDTVKTLLNSIRAQGILNTSDVDKLLEGINSKLEKLNTDEDVELIKVYLTELKDSMNERHSVLVSKFGAIESLFSNLLKNSSETIKSSEIKELFDIVSTNLSVFSREVVSQKEALNDISLRLDTMRSDDSEKQEIIKNITFLKTDLEHLNNGFDSIVLNLNDSFKSVLKSVSEINPEAELTEFASQIADVVSSSNAILSALQLIDKKNESIEDSIATLATQDDVNSAKRNISEMLAKNAEVVSSLEALTQKSQKIDSLSEKIDASVNIIAGLRTVLADNNDQNTASLITRFDDLETLVRSVSNEHEFSELKTDLDNIIRELLNGYVLQSKNNRDEIKEHVTVELNKLSQVLEADVTRTIGEINATAQSLSSRMQDSRAAIVEFCENSFGEVEDNISGIKTILAQLDENNISSNNAIFSNMTDRLTIFENSIKTLLQQERENTEKYSQEIAERFLNLKNLSGNLDYKLDSSVVEISNAKRELEELKTSVNDVLALDFVNAVKDFKVDLYAVKQELISNSDNITGELSEKLSNDLFSKYELLISKLDNVEDEVKQVQKSSWTEIKSALDNISASIVDVLSYVSVAKDANMEGLDAKFAQIENALKDNNLNYVEDVRNIVNSIKVQIDENISQIKSNSEKNYSGLSSAIQISRDDIKQDIKRSYDKLEYVQSNFDEIKEILNVNNVSMTTNVSDLLGSADNLKKEFEVRLDVLKNNLLEKVSEFKNDFSCENADKISEIKFNTENLHAKACKQAIDLKEELKNDIEHIIEELKIRVSSLSDHVSQTMLDIEGSNKEIVSFVKKDLVDEVNNSVDSIKNNTSEVLDSIDAKVSDIVNSFSSLELSVNNLSSETTTSLSATLSKILDNFIALKTLLGNLNEQTLTEWQISFGAIKKEFAEVKKAFEEADKNFDEDLERQVNIMEGQFDSLHSLLSDVVSQTTEALGEQIDEQLSGASEKIGLSVAEKLEVYKTKIEELFEGFKAQNDEQAEFIKNRALELNLILEQTLDKQNKDAMIQLGEISSSLKNALTASLEETTSDYVSLKEKLADFTAENKQNNEDLVSTIRAQLDDIIKFVDSNLDVQVQDINACFEKLKADINNLEEKMAEVQNKSSEEYNDIFKTLNDDLRPEVIGLSDKIASVVESSAFDIASKLTTVSEEMSEGLNSSLIEFKKAFETLSDKFERDNTGRLSYIQSKLKELEDKFNSLIKEAQDSIKTDIASVIVSQTDAGAAECQLIEEYADKILDQSEKIKQNTVVCKDIITKLVEEQFNLITKNIEKETDVIVGDLIEQFDILKADSKDAISSFTSNIEGSVAGYVIDAVNDLKSYLDIKTDTTIQDSKLDSLRGELSKYIDETTENINKLVEISVFSDAIGDLKSTNEVLITSMADKLNNQIQEFIEQNAVKKLDDKLNLFDKKFIDTVVDNYEEVKMLSSQYNDAFEKISASVSNLVTDFASSRAEFNSNIENLSKHLTSSIDELKGSFANLKAQILNKSFDEAFHASVHNQISGIENLVKEQIGYIEDINELCSTNLPEITEISAVVKFGIQKSISDLISKLNEQDEEVQKSVSDLMSKLNEQDENVQKSAEDLVSKLGENNAELTSKINEQQVNIKEELAKLKSDIITQFINVFNQISFVAEEEEILDFIQEKHSYLINVLSRIETNVDAKMDSLRQDISLINDKISAIMSSEGDVDYIYSLQDLESDIANLRIVLNEMKENTKSTELEELISSTNGIYNLVETFKKDFDGLSEDVVSISTRTNKLLLASDESYKMLQENLQDFRLVINDLDERSKNFVHDAGIDKIDSKLGTLNTMIQNGAKTNQVFNQVFEYLAEWVDKAGEQITTISDRVETLDDIGQIKIMLEDLKAEAADDSESKEIVEALGQVFEKQAKRINSLESKLDRLIVETTISNKNVKIDMTPLEDTLNSFLVSIGDKMSEQQEKIKTLETKLEEMVSLVDNKDTAQLTKKVGGMDKQLAKLNKSIEKIASNVVEK